jgi:hypothetical protein
VIRAAFGVDGEPELNRTYVELARHFGFQIDPTPPRSPEKKGKVERSCGYVKNNFLKTWDSIDIDEDRKALRRWLEQIAGTRCHATTRQAPLALFETCERDALIPLPRTPWEVVRWKRATLHRDSHVQIDAAFYSAPWRFLGQKLWVRCTPHSVSIYDKQEHLSTHARVGRGQRSTVESHLPDHRRDLRHRSRAFWTDKARAIGPEVLELAEALFEADDVLHQLRKVQAVVRLLEGYPRGRATRAARRALHFRCLDYRSLKSILIQGLDLEPLPEELEERAWSNGSRYARLPTDTHFHAQEKTHGALG